MSPLSVALQRWEAALIRAHVPGARYLGAGLNTGEVEDVLRGEGLQAVPDIVTFFSWHNGYAAGRPNESMLDPAGGHLLPLTQALEDYRGNLGAYLQDMDPGWFPIMARTGGWLAVDCRPDSGSPGQLRVSTYCEPLAICPSLTTVVGWWTKRLETGTWLYTPPGEAVRGWVIADRPAPETLESASGLV